MRRILTIDEAARSLRCSSTTVRRYVRAGRLAAIKRPGRTLIEREALKTFLDSHRFEAVACPNKPQRHHWKSWDEVENLV